MKLLIILLCALSITSALLEKFDRNVIEELLKGNIVSLSSVEARSRVGELPNRYQHLTPDDRKASHNARRFGEFSRAFFPTGYKNIPPLDPYQPVLDSVHISFLEPSASGELKLKGVRVTGLQAFKLVDLTFRLNYTRHTREDAVVTLPSLKLKADFTLDLMLKHKIPLPTITGRLKAQLTDITAKVAVGTSLFPYAGSSDDRVDVDAVKAFVRAEKVKLKVHFDEFDIANLVQEAANDIPEHPHLENLEKKAGEIIIDLAMKEVNKILAAYTYKQLKALILNRSS